VLCAPFVKAAVLRRLLAATPDKVSVTVVTRWRPEEVAAGVSDLEVYDVVRDRLGAELKLIDRLHAKLYLADALGLVGSANLTATALGWCDAPNLEILMPVAWDEPSLKDCMLEIEGARVATEAERERIAAAAAAMKVPRTREGAEVDEDRAGMWLPRLAAPARLYQAYAGLGADRLTAASRDSAAKDLEALSVPAGLSEPEFRKAVATAFAAMPVVARVLDAVDGDLGDDEAVEMIAALPGPPAMPAEAQWVVLREWMTDFLADTLEIAPKTYVTRRKPRPMR
jgi:hypothetical protein